MFIPIHQLNLYNTKERIKYSDRWEPINGGEEAYKLVLEKIRNGAGEDFLQKEYEYGILKDFLDDMYDLRGITITGEEIDFPKKDNFENMDFSYSHFYHSEFKNGYFRCSFKFAKFHKVTFHNCIFHNNVWLGAKFEKCKFINCDFIEGCKLINCSFSNTKFKHFFTEENLFSDCKFNSTVNIEEPVTYFVAHKRSKKSEYNYSFLSDFYNSIRQAFKAANVYDKERKYFFKSKQAGTNHNNNGLIDYLYKKFLIELLTGYGIKPFRAFGAGILIITVFSFVYYFNLNSISQSFLTSVSAFFTSGDYPASFFLDYKILYVTEGIFGWFILGLYLTTLVNVWFSER
ncbi:pentapeptide repeat-containing protein [Halanaerobium sp. MA284_MarDTE_T2]|nr:pentapeptide repeat-containing protein [Halanaerobium sp. MA284_MarDTE_T2]RCW48185.1 pentapeptide repeat protein [Halanaerobium sp. MA284_MarDTE_T2]RCW81639.1 pentapeptide repeat protein [Halanaerobium sp. DL-01]